jgi:alkanesulfonate monooxygenase SsuD/methylene tetrahydromethanopterin reductase-like flavin-dependent oxidoreductase (luciferase family)
MRYALFNHVPWPEGSTDAQVFADLLEQVQLAEELGFYSAWTTEHHFSRYGLAGASLLVMTHLAAQTSRIRLGTAIVIGPIRHPLHVAEESATFDVLSNGRLDLGIGTGSPIEVEAFGVAREESRARLREMCEMVRGLWTEPVYTHKGEFFEADAISLSPRPLQRPHPPVFVAGVSPETIGWTVDHDLGFMTGVIPDTQNALDLRRCYFDLAAAAGKSPDPADVPFFRYVYVGESEEAVRRDTEEAITWVWRCLDWIGARSQGDARSLDEWLSDGPVPAMSYEQFYEQRGFFGTPDRVRRQLGELRDSHGVSYFGANFAFGGLSQKLVLQSMRLFADEVAAKL